MNKRFTLLLNVDHPIWGISSVGRAPALHAGGQEFESPNLQFKRLIRTPSDESFNLFNGISIISLLS